MASITRAPVKTGLREALIDLDELLDTIVLLEFRARHFNRFSQISYLANPSNAPDIGIRYQLSIIVKDIPENPL
jgi:hypothetical protein